MTLIGIAPKIKNTCLVLLGRGPWRDKLRTYVQEKQLDNVHILDAVSPSELLDYVASADIGISYIERISDSYYYSLPNKIGEFIMGGIPIIASNYPEMSKIVLESDIGVTFDPEDPEDMLRALETLLDEETYSKKLANMPRAKKMYNWENEEKKLIGLYSDIEKKEFAGR